MRVQGMTLKVFDKNTPIDAIVQWARDVGGKLIITISEPENKS
jgi:hypothetical protein